MPFPNPRLCIFGDSHTAALKEALKQGLVSTDGVDIEFWVNVGRRFRYLNWKNNRIEPMDEFTARRFSKFNESNRMVLAADDFDMILFAGCRLSLYKLFPELLHRLRTPNEWISTGLQRRILADFMRNFPPYQFACNFAKQGKAIPVFAPISFDTDGVAIAGLEEYKNATKATKTNRKAIWDIIDSIMVEDGIVLMRQDEKTVTKGFRTKGIYGVENYLEKQDVTHKNAKYGAIVLTQAVQNIKSLPENSTLNK